MPDHLFFHYFYNPKPHYNSKWMPRLPKKLDRSIFCNTEQLPEGWGVHIVESAHYYTIFLSLFLGFVLSGVLSVAWAILRNDVQGAFSIGTWIVTLEATWMTAIFFKWKQH